MGILYLLRRVKLAWHCAWQLGRKAVLLPSKRTCHFRSQRGSAWSLGTPLGHLFSLCRCKWESATYFSVALEAGGLDSLFLGTRSSALCVHPSPTIGLLSFLLYRHPLPRRLLPGNAKCISTLTSLPSARIEISLLLPSLPPHLQGITSPDSSEFSRGCCKRW